MDLIPLDNELSVQRQWQRCDELARRYGMQLTQQQFQRLTQARRQALQDTGRIDFGGGVLDQLVYAFCDSPFVESRSFASFLEQMQELFYIFKNETQDAVTDEELIQALAALFNGEAQGSLEYLAEIPPQRLVRMAYGKEICR